jgi:hypothetical protein
MNVFKNKATDSKYWNNVIEFKKGLDDENNNPPA